MHFPRSTGAAVPARTTAVLPIFMHDPTHVDTYRAQWGRNRRVNPEIELRIAVLEQAIHDLNLPEPKGGDSASERAQHLRRQAKCWFEGGWATHPYSYCKLCEALGIDPAVLRAQIFKNIGLRLVTTTPRTRRRP